MVLRKISIERIVSILQDFYHPAEKIKCTLRKKKHPPDRIFYRILILRNEISFRSILQDEYQNYLKLGMVISV